MIKPHFLDTSALLKLVVTEDGSDRIRQYIDRETVFFTGSICVAEALGVLKTKHFYKKDLSDEGYFRASHLLFVYLRTGKVRITEEKDLSLSDQRVFFKTEALAKKYNIDLADALQIVMLLSEPFSLCVDESTAILITADGGLADAARQEGLLVWNCLREDNPPKA